MKIEELILFNMSKEEKKTYENFKRVISCIIIFKYNSDVLCLSKFEFLLQLKKTKITIFNAINGVYRQC